jgi:hypothetical protein
VVQHQHLQTLLRCYACAKQAGCTGTHNHNVKGFHAVSLVVLRFGAEHLAR